MQTTRRAFLKHSGALAVGTSAGLSLLRCGSSFEPAVTDLTSFDGVGLAGLVRKRQVTPLELVEDVIRRVEEVNGPINAVLTTLFDADKARIRSQGELGDGPLAGVPVMLKNLIAYEEAAIDSGSRLMALARERGISRPGTSPLVTAMENSGMIVTGITNTPEMGLIDTTEPRLHGPTRNPWNTAQGSSGSSAGPGSATAAGCVGFALGTETRGSITSPSTRNGVTGHRPTYGRVSRAGAMTLSWSMDKIGPMCRAAEDCALVFAAIHGADGLDPSARSVPFAWDPYRDPRTLRVGYLAGAFEEGPRYDNREFDLATLRALREEIGIEMVPVALPEFPVGAMSFILTAEAGAAFEELTLSGRDDLMKNSSWPNTFRTARFIPAVDYINANRARTIYMQHFSEVMRDIDVFVTPTSRGGVVGATNLTGHPQVVVPNGFSAQGTPYSISFVGGLYKDAEALLLAHAYQQVSDFHLRHPDVDAQPMPGDEVGAS